MRLAATLVLGAFLAMPPAVGVAQPAADAPEVNLFVPRLAGATDLTENVSTVLVLRLWTQLHRKGEGDQDDRFGVGRVKWSSKPLPDFDPQTALQVGANSQSRLVLWGSAENYGPGVVVQANLSVVPEADLATADVGTWAFKFNGVEIALGLPATSFQLAPLVLRNEIVTRYSTPKRILICPTKSETCDGLRLTPSFRAYTAEGDWVYVGLSTGQKGWAHLPEISDVDGDLIAFSTGMICYLRGDFGRAKDFFRRVRDGTSPGPIRDSAQVLLGISEVRSGKSIDELARAEKINPYSRFNLQAHVMGLMSLGLATSDNDRKHRWLDEAQRLLDARKHLFRADDPWLKAVETALAK